MATVSRQPISNLHDKLVVKITKEDYLPSFEKSLKLSSKQANIPGFRKGHVPVGMIKKMYGPSLFMDEVIRTANEQLSNFLKEEQTNIFAQPLPIQDENLKIDMNDPQDYEFAFELGIKPEVNPAIIEEKKGSVNRYKIIIEDKMLDEEIANIKKRAGKLENVESLENDTDFVYATYTTEGKDAVEDVVSFDKLPQSFQEKLKGAAPEATFTFSMSELSEEEAADLLKTLKAGEEAKEATYTFTLTKIGRLAERELNTEFFEEVFPGQDVADEEAFRARIKEEMGKEVTRIGNDRLQNDIFELLVHETPMELPEAFLKSWIQKGGEKTKTDEEVEAEWPSFQHQLRWTLISDKLVQHYNLQVTLEEVQADMKAKVLAYFGNMTEENAPWLESYMQQMMKDENTLNETYRRLLFDKLFDKIATEMNVEEKEISLEDFQNLGNAHHNH